MQKNRLLITTALLVLGLVASMEAAEIMPLSEVRKGMKGYGLTVFDGTKIERFDVEVMGVLNSIGPRQDIILVRVDSEATDKSGVIAGMSGSPIYIDGKVIGALAYSWQFSSVAVAGVTPIEEMLRIGTGGAAGLTGAPAAPVSTTSFLSSIVNHHETAAFQEMIERIAPSRGLASAGVLPIATPLAMSGFSAETIGRFSAPLQAAGFMPVPSGSATTGMKSGDSASARTFEPGDPIAGVLVDGDLMVAATGTVTHVDGDRILAFGHPFLDLGEITFPMAKSEVVGVLPNLARSFKFSNTGPVVGSLKEDRFAGILGYLGVEPEMIPVELTLDAGGEHKTYQLRVIRHPQLSPLMIAMATDSVVAGAQKAAGERTIVLDSEIQIDGFPPIRLHEGWAGTDARQAIPAYLAIVSNYLLSNEFHDAKIERVKIHLFHDDNVRTARLLQASVIAPSSGQIHPGDTIQVRVALKPYRGDVFQETFDVKIPSAESPGSAYLFVAGGTAMNQLDFGLRPPDPRNLAQVVGVIERLRSSTDLVLGLYSKSEGAVTAGVYLPELPPSVSAVVNDDSSNSVRVPVRYHSAEKVSRSLDYIVDGALKIDLQIQPRL